MTPTALAASTDQQLFQRWSAKLDLNLARRHGRTAMVSKRQLGPLSVQRSFYPEGGLAHIYLLHPPGGIAGGDDLDINVSMDTEAEGLVTTPGAAKFYRSSGALAHQRQMLKVADGATLEWFPQENIFFPGAKTRLATDIQLEGTARIAAWEIQCLGRPVIGERFDHGSMDARLGLLRDGRPLLKDRLRINRIGDLDGRSGLRGFPVSGTLLLNGCSKEMLDAARETLPPLSDSLIHGLTLVDDLLIARALGNSAEPVRNLFIKIWRQWRPRVLEREPCEPRIWAT